MSSRRLGSRPVGCCSERLGGVGRAGVIRFVNGQAESLFRCARDDLLGQPIEMLVPESVRSVHAAHREGYFAPPGVGARDSMGTKL